jgi:hypothetical protein
MESTFFRVVVFYVIFVNVFWYAVKYVLRAEGFRVSLFAHFRDFYYLHQLVRREKDPTRRVYFRGLLFSLYGVLVLFPIVVWTANFLSR